MPSAPPPDDPSLQPPRGLYFQVVHDLDRSLPAAADTPDAATHSIHAAIASMLPANAEEASLAVRCVAAHPGDRLPVPRPPGSRRCRPRHALRAVRRMMRTANSA